jgi:pimeloyl-ACP methyl ester carboxylesterase
VQQIAYDDVRDAWLDYLAHDNDGRPFVLIGHSQGAMLLTRLVQDEIDKNAAVRTHLLSAILLGANVTTQIGKPAGGSFINVPACTSTGQKGCVIAYSSYATTPPSYALFGHTNNGGEQVLCTDPSVLAGTAGLAHPYVPSGRVIVGPKALPGTAFVAYPGGIRTACHTGAGAIWLQVSTPPGSQVPPFQASLGPAWGLHVADVTLALGDLVEAVRRQEAR